MTSSCSGTASVALTSVLWSRTRVTGPSSCTPRPGEGESSPSPSAASRPPPATCDWRRRRISSSSTAEARLGRGVQGRADTGPGRSVQFSGRVEDGTHLRRASSLSLAGPEQLCHQLLDSSVDLIPDRTNLLEGPTCGVGQFPVEVSLPG